MKSTIMLRELLLLGDFHDDGDRVAQDVLFVNSAHHNFVQFRHVAGEDGTQDVYIEGRDDG